MVALAESPPRRKRTDIVTVPAPATDRMQLADVLNHVKLVGDIMREVMREGEHYGPIPGCGSKKCLLQPGAQKLCMTFKLAPKYRVTCTLLDGTHREYEVICVLRSMGTQTFISQGVGQCSTKESKYMKRPPMDVANTVLKMAKKRAFVDAVLTATAASDIFTQDIGDDDKTPSPAFQRLRKDAEQGTEALREAWKAMQPELRQSLTADEITNLKAYAGSVDTFIKERA